VGGGYAGGFGTYSGLDGTPDGVEAKSGDDGAEEKGHREARGSRQGVDEISLAAFTILADNIQALEKFFQTTLDTLLRQLDLSESKPILLASPGFVAQAFLKFILETATRTGNKALLAQRSNFVVVHSASGYLHSLNEVLQTPEVLARLKDTKYARESKLMEEFMNLLYKDDGKAAYGPREVEQAVEKGAVGRGGGILLISDSLFRAQDVAIRRRWVGLVDKVWETEGGEVRVLSSTHQSGTQLEGLGGIAAILTFPLEYLDEEDEEANTGG